MPTPFRNNSAAFSVDGFVFARSVLDQKGDDAVTILLEAAGGNETDWLEKKAAVYRTEKVDEKFRKKMDKIRASKKITPQKIAEEEDALQSELLAEIAWAIVAMHNSRGGVILVGIDDRNGVVPLEDNDPDGIVAKKGVGGYALDFVLGRLFREEFILKKGQQQVKLSLPVAKTGVFSMRRQYEGTEIVALLVPALERGKEPLLATRTTNNSPWYTVPQRGAGDVGLVIKGQYVDRWMQTAAQLDAFLHDRDLRFLDRMDLAVRFRELGLSLSSAGTAGEPPLRDKELFSSVRPPRAKNFVGRDKELEELHGLLSKGTITIVTGPGGTGKTELVRHYVVRHKADYPGGLFQIDMEGITEWEQAFRLMLEKPGVRDALGLPENEEDEIGGEAEKELPDIHMAEMGDGTGMPFVKYLKEGIVRKSKTKSVPEILSARASREGPILLVLDNVDPPACKTLFKETALAKLNLQAEVRILATARACDLTFPANGICREYQLPDFLSDVAVDFLTAAHPADTEAERKAVESVARMLDCRILYLEAVPSLMGDDDSPFAGSWQALERGLQDDLESVVDAGMEDDEARKPAALWRQKVRLFAANSSNGARWILLARIASFFSPDLGVRKTVLSALWKRLAKPEGDPDVAFSQAANKLWKHGVLEDRDGKYGMHRVTRAAIRRSARNDEPDLEESIGLVLAETGLSESRDWVSLAGSLPALRHVPEDQLDGRTSVDILCDNIQFANQCPWSKLDYFDWKKLIVIHPQLIDRLQQSAEEGSAGAQTALGFCCSEGRGMDQNYEEAVKWYRKAAEQGNGPAQNNLGVCYDNGQGVEQNYEEAVKWFRKAAEQGRSIAQFNLGVCYSNGQGVERRVEEAVKWYRKSAEQGYAAAQCNLGLCYANGQGVERSAEEAVKWYRKAAEQGNASAQYNLGVCYDNGQGVERSAEEAVKWYRKAAEQGNASAQYNLGVCYDNGQGVERSAEEAVKWYRKAAEQGNASAQYNLGLCYANGQGVERSAEEAVKWYRKAAEQGNASAQYNLGVCYDNGQGVERSAEEAVKWYRKAAEQGNASAQYNLGVCYDNGRGVERSAEEAVKWYRKSAEQGDGDAQNTLGHCFDEGLGVSQNYEEAVKWYRKAAEQEVVASQSCLGYCYDKGLGVSQNYEEAVRWYRKAAEQGNASAQYNLGVCYYNGWGVERSAEEAVKWCRKSAEQGDGDAQNTLGHCFDEGLGVSQNYEEAVKWYRKAAEQEVVASQSCLGYCYDKGLGVSQNYEEAVRWYRKAAEQGSADAQNNLGYCYANGQGLVPSFEEAVKWYRKAADQGNAVAQSNLGACYANGQGVEPSSERAVEWWRKAAEQGDERAFAWLGYCFASGTGTAKDERKSASFFAKIKCPANGFNGIAWWLFKFGKASEALPFAEKAVAAFRGDGEITTRDRIGILDTLAAVLDALERAEETKGVCSEILSLFSADDDSKDREVAFVRLGRACHRLNDKAGAADAWSKALAIVEKHGGECAEYGESADELRRLIRESGGTEP